MGNRVFSGNTGTFEVSVFEEGDDEMASPVAIGRAIYARAGEYNAEYNVTMAGDFSLHVSSFQCFDSSTTCAFLVNEPVDVVCIEPDQ